MLLKLFGRRGEEDELFARKAATVRDLGVRISLLTRIFAASMMAVPALATALVYGVGGHLAIDRHADRRHPARPGHPAAAPARPAPEPLQRAHRRDDRPGQLRAGLRGARPAVADRGEAGRRRAAARRPRASSSTTSRSATRAPTRSRWPRSRRSPARSPATAVRCCTTSRFVAEPGQMVALVGPSGAGKTTITHLVARLYDVDGGAVRVGGHDVRDVTLQSLEDVVGYVTQDAHMFHDTIRANLLYARPGADRPEIWAALEAAQIAPPGPGAARRARHRRRRPRLPALRRRAAAARDRPAAAEGARDRRARRGDRPPRQRVRGRRPARPRRRARGPHVAGDRPPALDRPQRRPDPGRRRRPDRRSAAPTPRCSPRAASTPTSTAPSSSRTCPPTPV